VIDFTVEGSKSITKSHYCPKGT